jgi:hypothetical protein
VPDPITAPSGKMFLAFSTNYSGTADGWTAYYETDLVRVPDMQAEDNISIYPNPASDLISIRFDGTSYSRGIVYLTDLSGKVLLSRKIDNKNDHQFELDVNSINPGMYILIFENGSNICFYRKVVII